MRVKNRSIQFALGRSVLVMIVALVAMLALVIVMMTSNAHQLILALALILIGFSGLFILLMRTMQRSILLPVSQIASTVQRVTLYKDFSLRVTQGEVLSVPHEIESLISAFNSMLKEIEDRDNKLLRKTQELEKAKLAAEAASVAKSQFLANISHELRTPLNSIIGFSNMMKDQQFGPLETHYLTYATDIYDSGKHLLEIINDILDLSKAEAGKLTMNFESFVLPKIIDKAMNMLAQRAETGGVTLVSEVPSALPKMIGDKVRMLQIVINLLSNAVKFTNAGGKVTVRVQAEAGNNHVHYFTIEVEDTGIGMTESEIQQAFLSFNQIDAGLNRKREGTGLGLSLTKKLVELHNGTIRLESKKSVGTKAVIRVISDPTLLT
jgi:signal transduction histidine kinase